MKRISILAAALLLAGTASAGAGSTGPARAYDIVTQVSIPAGASCGHYATSNGNGIWGLDWAVNGVVVAEDADSGINYQNDGSPYTVAFGEVVGGVFQEWYSEVFYPEPNDGPFSMACLEV
ncbi:hypothetical protein [Longimicrobium sp.]|uniref:hypothetical protein n=1 Tax=Longimicrobium sp. TaxID=2029185 RepID=UPI002E33162F|nr:hypothetical protein [Longimicrobium sp.]HEX6037542.1 hypothetical protein [Longimicrobium sp.]